MPVVRKATVRDAGPIASCLLFAMEDIVYKFIGENDQAKAQSFMLHLVEKANNQYSYQNCLVFESKLEVVAAINIYDGARLRELRQPVLEYLRSGFGRDFAPEDETQPGEYYIDSLGVNTNLRGQGIGTTLLKFVIEEHVTRQGRTVGLLVEEKNPNAKRLYLKLGFKSAGRKVFLGKNMDHLQISG